MGLGTYKETKKISNQSSYQVKDDENRIIVDTSNQEVEIKLPELEHEQIEKTVQIVHEKGENDIVIKPYQGNTINAKTEWRFNNPSYYLELESIMAYEWSFEQVPSFVNLQASTVVAKNGENIGGYNSIQQAIDESSPGVTILIYPGVYNEPITLKDQVDLYFYSGAIVQLENSDSLVLTDGGNYVNSQINGYGVFRHINSTKLNDFSGAVGYFYGGSDINLESEEIYISKISLSSAHGGIISANGSHVHLRLKNVLCVGNARSSSDSYALYANSGSKMYGKVKNLLAPRYGVRSRNGGIINVKAKNILTFTKHSASVGNAAFGEIGFLKVKADNIYAYKSGIELTAENDVTNATDVDVKAKNIYSPNNGVVLNTRINELNLRNTKIVTNNNALQINNKIEQLNINNCTFYGNIDSISQDVIIKGDLLLDGNNDNNLNSLTKSITSFSDPYYHTNWIEWYWTDGICVKDENGNNTGNYRRKVLNSRKLIDNIELVDASSQPPSENDGDQFVLNYASSVHSDWGTAGNGDKVEYNGTSGEWQVIENIPKKYTDYERKSFDITNAFSWGDPKGTITPIDYPSLTDDEFSKLTDSEYQDRWVWFIYYVYFNLIPQDLDNINFYNIDQLATTTYDNQVVNIVNNDDEKATGDASNATNISCPI